MKKLTKFFLICSLLFWCQICLAVPSLTISTPNVFSANTTIYSSEMNSNFNEVSTKYNAHHHTIVSADITDGTIVNADIAAAADITASKLDSTVVETDTDQTISGDKTFSGSLTASGTVTLPATDVVIGTANQGDIYYDDGTDLARLTPGTSGQFLKTQGAAANPVWATAFTETYFEPDSTCVLAFDNGSLALDLSTLQNAITLTGVAESDLTAGKVSAQVYTYDGTNDFVTVADSALFAGMATLTIEAWVYWTGAGTDGIIDIATDSYIQLQMTTTNVISNIRTSSGIEAVSVAHGLSGSGKNAWVHFVIAWNNSGAAEVYVNGADVGDGDDAGNGTVNNSVNDLIIGDNGAGTGKFAGKIDGVRLLRRKMGATEVSNRYDAFK